MKPHTYKWLGALVLLVFFIVGSLYAMFTPLWQAPDEPAHYNYIRTLALGEGFPLMEMGDYDQDYLSQLTSEGFPPSLSVTPLEYEDHQPPLYYLLATPVYLLSDGSLIVLRIFSVMLGAFAVAMVMLTASVMLPERPGIAVLAGALLAFIPQFVAMCASINNDALGYALLWLWLWLALRYLKGKTKAWHLGLVMGLLLLTKSTVYSVVPLAALLGLFKWRRDGKPFKAMLGEWAWLVVPALTLGLLWWGRNSVVYGFPDVMGLQRHNEIVLGQPRTADWIAAQGLLAFLKGALRTTFQSFWGQFGWMGVVLDARIYQALMVYCLLVFIAVVAWLVDALKTGLSRQLRDGLLLLAALTLITTGLFLYYNITFVQLQGRYLFPGLPMLAIATALGFSHLLERRTALITGATFGGICAILIVMGLIAGDFAVWVLMFCAAIAVGVPVASYVPERYRALLAGGFISGAVLLDLVCLFGFIIPILT